MLLREYGGLTPDAVLELRHVPHVLQKQELEVAEQGIGLAGFEARQGFKEEGEHRGVCLLFRGEGVDKLDADERPGQGVEVGAEP